MSEVFVPFLSKFPVFGFMVLDIPENSKAVAKRITMKLLLEVDKETHTQ